MSIDSFDSFDDELASDVRPFLFADNFDNTPAPASLDADFDEVGTRDYLLTGGRADGGRAGVHVDTIVSAAALADDTAKVAELGSEAQAIVTSVRLDARPVAEVARQVGLSLGVTRVLVGDLVDDGYLMRAAAPQNQVSLSLLEALMAGIESL